MVFALWSGRGKYKKLVADQKPDILMIQEIKGTADQFSQFLTAHEDYQQHYSSAREERLCRTSIWISHALEASFRMWKFKTTIPKAPNADEGRIAQLSLFKRGSTMGYLFYLLSKWWQKRAGLGGEAGVL